MDLVDTLLALFDPLRQIRVLPEQPDEKSWTPFRDGLIKQWENLNVVVSRAP